MKLHHVKKIPVEFTTEAVHIHPFVATYCAIDEFYVVSCCQRVVIPIEFTHDPQHVVMDLALIFGFELNPLTLHQYAELALCNFIACNIFGFYSVMLQAEMKFVSFYKCVSK